MGKIEYDRTQGLAACGCPCVECGTLMPLRMVLASSPEKGPAALKTPGGTGGLQRNLPMRSSATNARAETAHIICRTKKQWSAT